jgi:hypothetical protein
MRFDARICPATIRGEIGHGLTAEGTNKLILSEPKSGKGEKTSNTRTTDCEIRKQRRRAPEQGGNGWRRPPVGLARRRPGRGERRRGSAVQGSPPWRAWAGSSRGKPRAWARRRGGARSVAGQGRRRICLVSVCGLSPCSFRGRGEPQVGVVVPGSPRFFPVGPT